MGNVCEMAERRRGPKRDAYERRNYAAQRAVIALDRAIRITLTASPADRDKALGWMRLWVAFAASRRQKIATRAVKAA
jgi:hypothetical protein